MLLTRVTKNYMDSEQGPGAKFQVKFSEYKTVFIVISKNPIGFWLL